MRTLLIFLALCACASAQPFAPLQYHRTTATAFLPDQVDSLVYWLDASSITGKSSGDTIGIWSPRVGATNMVQLTSAQKPIYYADSLGGKPAVYADGSDDYMKAIPVRIHSADLTAFVVRKRRTLKTGNARVIGFGSGTGSDFVSNALVIADTNATTLNMYAYSNTFLGNATLQPVNVPELITVEITGAKTVLTRDTANTTNTGATSITISDYVALFALTGASSFSNSFVAEVLVYTRYLTSTEKTNIWMYLKAKYGI